MIYIFRHQEGNVFTNCLNKNGINNSYVIANKIKDWKYVYIYTLLPTINGKHIRPFQTASIISSELNIYLNFIKNEFPNNVDNNCKNIIIWHHSDIKNILKMYFPKSEFEWDKHNYTGCLIIKEKEWEFEPKFFKQYNIFYSFWSFFVKLFSCKS